MLYVRLVQQRLRSNVQPEARHYEIVLGHSKLLARIQLPISRSARHWHLTVSGMLKNSNSSLRPREVVELRQTRLLA
jgi:hypothetical protein